MAENDTKPARGSDPAERASRRLFLGLAAGWTLAVSASLTVNLQRDRARVLDLAYSEARANVNKDLSFRRWATTHGGVYVPITETQQSIPFLAHVPGRDVTTMDGRQLTLLNPASMLRQIMERHAADYGIRGRITGLKWLNPDNAPDDWERLQLERFTRGEVKEVWEVAKLDGAPYLRHLRAMFMEKGCEKCHAVLGYKQGDMRGATGVNIPLSSYYALSERSRLDLGVSHGLMWLLGLGGLGAAYRMVRQRDRESVRRDEEREKNAETIRIYANMFERSGEAMLITDRDNRIVSVNPALVALTGYSKEELIGKDPHMLSSGMTAKETYDALWQSLATKGYWQGEMIDRRKDGSVYTKWASVSVIVDERCRVAYHVASYNDITARKEAEKRIEHLAHHDVLTGLYNRYSLTSRLQQVVVNARREGEQLAVMFIDLDRFKIINDTLGHGAGDALLIQVASRLKAAVRESDIVGRLGGDEFVVVVTGLADANVAASLSSKIRQAIGEPYEVEGRPLHTTPSVGVAVFPNDGEDAETLMRNADTAMYHAKEQGRNAVQFFTEAMNASAQERLELESDLRRAIDGGELVLHYQPQVRADSGRLCGVEALVRWQHPKRGLLPPGKFIPLAEETGLIGGLGTWVLDEATRQQAAWRAEGFTGFKMAVNLSAVQLRSSELVAQVRDAIARHALLAGDLELEVTESVAMADPERAISLLRELRELGAELAIDDFGTGYSSLAYLKRLPIHTLKLDRAFVRDIESDPNDAAISSATLALAHSLGLQVVAEGVETDAQRLFLCERGCEVLQGYLFDPPLNADVLRERWQGRSADTGVAA